MCALWGSAELLARSDPWCGAMWEETARGWLSVAYEAKTSPERLPSVQLLGSDPVDLGHASRSSRRLRFHSTTSLWFPLRFRPSQPRPTPLAQCQRRAHANAATMPDSRLATHQTLPIRAITPSWLASPAILMHWPCSLRPSSGRTSTRGHSPWPLRCPGNPLI